MPPALHILVSGHQYVLQAGQIARIGADNRAEITVVGTQIAPHHATVGYANGWKVVMQDGCFGYVNNAVVAGVDITEPVSLTLGDPASWTTLNFGLADAQQRVVSGNPGRRADNRQSGAASYQSSPQFQVSDAQPRYIPVPNVPVTIGNAGDNTIRLDDFYASRHHARISVTNGGLVLEDLGSTNGTYCEGKRVSTVALREGNRITIGNTDILISGGAVVRDYGELENGGLIVDHVEFAIAGGKKLINNVSFTAKRKTLTAVIGPSGAGKSTLSRLLAGVTKPTSGHVRFDTYDLSNNYELVKSRIGLVPQDDVVHRQLKVRPALEFAARLRLSSQASTQGRHAQVAKATRQLGLQQHLNTRIDKLSGGQRKRASVAMELLTEPALLVLDEPTSGLDPALDRQVMHTLRDLADDGDGRAVLVITHSVAYLDMCDQVLILAPGGMTAYIGPPAGVPRHFGTSDWGDIFQRLADDPAGSAAAWAVRHHAPELPATGMSSTYRPAAPVAVISQYFTLIVRQLRTLTADFGYFMFLLVLPVVMGLLPFVVPGKHGLNYVGAEAAAAGEPQSILALLIVGATFMGISMSIRELVGEREIFLREQAVGLSSGAYILAKLTVYGVFSVILSAIMVAVATLVKDAPEQQLMNIGSATFELWIPIMATTWVCAALGLLLSAFIRSNDQVMPVLIVALMVQLVLQGGLISIADNRTLNAVSQTVPARWGYAAAASSIDLNEILIPKASMCRSGEDASDSAQCDDVRDNLGDKMWKPSERKWRLDLSMLALFGMLFSVGAWMKVRFGRK